MTGGLARPPLSPTGLQKRPTCRIEANKKLQKDIYYFFAVIFSLKVCEGLKIYSGGVFYAVYNATIPF
jgi:hypothetical protein